jgi:hypothetical protein
MDPAEDLGSENGGYLIVARQSPIHGEAAQPGYGARDGLALLNRRYALDSISHDADIIIVLMP